MDVVLAIENQPNERGSSIKMCENATAGERRQLKIAVVKKVERKHMDWCVCVCVGWKRRDNIDSNQSKTISHHR